MCAAVQTTIELDHIDQGMGQDGEWNQEKADRVSYHVTLHTRPDKSGNSRVMIFITLTGMIYLLIINIINMGIGGFQLMG